MPGTGRSGRRPELSGLELEIMNVVWDLGECSSAEVIHECRNRRRLADTTIRTVLSNIRRKGYLETVPSVERGFRFRATVSRQAIAQRSLKQLVKNLFQGSPQDAIAYLIDDEDITETELSEIRSLVEQHKRHRGDDSDA
jgi:predicted transcriptional regulator